MRKTLLLPLLCVLLLAACQPKIKVVPVDLNASTAAVTALMDKIYHSMSSRNADEYISVLTDNALMCGTDPKEFWNKKALAEMLPGMMADTTADFNFKLDKREIRITEDGNTAIVIDQALMSPISKKIAVRRIFHLVKSNDTWKVDLDAYSMIPTNEDLVKLNKALE